MLKLWISIFDPSSLLIQGKMQAAVIRRESLDIGDRMLGEFEEKLKVFGGEWEDEEVKREELEEEVEGGDEEEDDFSFACMNPDGSPIAADAVFQNGQIRPTFPLFDRSLLYDVEENERRAVSAESATVRPLRKLFVEEENSKEEEPTGPYCEWKSAKTVKEVAPPACKKSNSTGFSKLWRFRELVTRSNSDGRDAFVFLNGDNISDKEKSKSSSSSSSSASNGKTEKSRKHEKAASEVKMGKSVEKVKIREVKADTVSSAYERHYVKNREMREGVKRKTYSPYKPELFGFFTNVNGMSKNVHPY